MPAHRGVAAPNRIDLLGQRFGMLVVIGSPERRGKRIFWPCRCDCGRLRTVHSQTLRLGVTHHCGCQPKRAPERLPMRGTPTYQSWLGIKARCADPDNPYYGGRGITVCERWERSFDDFLADMGEAPPGTSIERVNNNGNYEPGNCRWATRVEQSQNRSCAITITVHGETLNLAEWSRRTGVDYHCLYKRIVTLGWSPEAAIPRPLKAGGGWTIEEVGR